MKITAHHEQSGIKPVTNITCLKISSPVRPSPCDAKKQKKEYTATAGIANKSFTIQRKYIRHITNLKSKPDIASTVRNL